MVVPPRSAAELHDAARGWLGPRPGGYSTLKRAANAPPLSASQARVLVRPPAAEEQWAQCGPPRPADGAAVGFHYAVRGGFDV